MAIAPFHFRVHSLFFGIHVQYLVLGSLYTLVLIQELDGNFLCSTVLFVISIRLQAANQVSVFVSYFYDSVDGPHFLSTRCEEEFSRHRYLSETFRTENLSHSGRLSSVDGPHSPS